MKKWILRMIALCLCAALLSSCDEVGPTEITTNNGETTTTEEIPAVETAIAYENYRYHSIHFDQGVFDSVPYMESKDYIIRIDSHITIDYIYYLSMYRIANYVSLVDHYLKNQSADAEDMLLSKYFQKTPMIEYVKYYDDLMLNAVQLLYDNGFAPAELSSAELLDFMNKLDYCVWGKERYTVLALGFMDIENQFMHCVENLRAFSAYCQERYPDGDYELFISESDLALIQGIEDAANAISKNRERLRTDWIRYYTESMTGLRVSVTEEYIPEKYAVKLTIYSDAKCMVDVPTQYIENLAHTVGENGVVKPPKEALFSPVIVYLPLAYYNEWSGLELPLIYIMTYNENNEGHEEAYRMQIDPRSYCSEESLTLSDPFLHRIMTGLFGSAYSERDLTRVYTMMFYQWADGTLKVRITYYQDSAIKKTKEFDYESVMGEKAPLAMTAEMQESLTHFHGLFSVSGNQGYTIPSALWKEIRPYSVAQEWHDRFYG